MLPCSGFFIPKVLSDPVRRKLQLTMHKSAFLGKRYVVGGRNVSKYLDYRRRSISLPCMLIFTLVSVGKLGRACLKDMSSDVFYPFPYAGAWHALEESLPVIVIYGCGAALQWLMKCLWCLTEMECFRYRHEYHKRHFSQ